MEPMILIAVTAEAFFEGEAKALNLLFENGLECLHLRKPSATQDETESLIERINAHFRARVVLSDHYCLAQPYGLKGIHLNSRNMGFGAMSGDGAGGNAGRKNKLSVSRSCHTFEEVRESAFCDYVFLSPIFDSLSKLGYKHAFTRQQLANAKAEGIVNEKTIALGGVTAKNIPAAYALGFGGVAVLGALWNDFAHTPNMNELAGRFNELKQQCEAYCS